MAKFSTFLVVFIALCAPYLVKAQCTLNPDLVEEIRSYESVVKQIIDKVINGDFKGRLFNDTATFVDTIGSRVVGSEALANGINYHLNWMRDQGFDEVHGEDIVTPNWIR